MAVLSPSPTIVAPTGSIGGITLRQHRGKTVLLPRHSPRRFRSLLQRAQCVNFSRLTAYWRDTLTIDQRLAWHRFASLTPMNYNPGPPKFLPGREAFIQTNIIRLRAALAILAAAPPVGAISAAPVPVMSMAAANTITVYTTGEMPAAGDTFLFSLSRQHSPAAANPRITYRQHFVLTGPISTIQYLFISAPYRSGYFYTMHTRRIRSNARPSTFHTTTLTF